MEMLTYKNEAEKKRALGTKCASNVVGKQSVQKTPESELMSVDEYFDK